jgi:hypothetical protein
MAAMTAPTNAAASSSQSIYGYSGQSGHSARADQAAAAEAAAAAAHYFAPSTSSSSSSFREVASLEPASSATSSSHFHPEAPTSAAPVLQRASSIEAEKFVASVFGRLGYETDAAESDVNESSIQPGWFHDFLSIVFVQ